jgi:hypothetical protein
LRGSAEVTGKTEVTFVAGTELVTLVDEMRKAINVAGRLNVAGPGSNGKSSPDAEAP